MMTQARPRTVDLATVAEAVFRYARRWAVSQAAGPEDAIIYDAAVALLESRATRHWQASPQVRSATNDRYLLSGPEQVSDSFEIPIRLEEAVVALHRFARRSTNGRGTFTAAIVNEAARELLRLGVDLSGTRALDGTIWAADGQGGEHDTLSPQQHDEALAALPTTS